MSFNYGLRPTTVQMIALSGGSSTQSAAFGSQSEYVRICSNAAVHILFGLTQLQQVVVFLYLQTNQKFLKFHQVKKLLLLVQAVMTYLLLR